MPGLSTVSRVSEESRMQSASSLRGAAAKSHTAAMEQDVISMETRLAQLKATMQSEREKRDSARGRNPTGAVWRSARTDVPVNSSSYVDKVLKSKDVAAQQAGQDAAAAKPTQPLLRAGSLPVAPPSGGPAPFGKTRASFDWNPSASLVDLGGDLGGDYEDLLGPEGGSNAHEPPPASGGGALLEGEFDEAANSAAFADAVREWRTDGAAAAGGGGGGPSQTGILLGAGRIDVGGSDRSVVAGAVGGGGGFGAARAGKVSSGANTGSSGTGTGSGGGLLEGDAFDEEASSASFAEALNAWRSGGGSTTSMAAAPKRASRFGAAAPPAAPASSEPTLADKVHALKMELSLPMELSMSEAVAIANGAVGLSSMGTLADQVGRLLRETGIKPVRGCAPGGAPPPPNGSTSPGAQSCGSRPASARPPSRSGGVQTQTRPPKSFFEMLQDQKRKDGVL